MEKSALSLQVLVSTMHQTDTSLLDRMNICTEAIVINQCDRNEVLSFEHRGHTVRWLSLQERGVGLSRNSALARATADILLFADDDVTFDDGYREAVTNFFEKHPKVGLAVFNLTSLNPDRPEYIVEKDHRLKWHNCLRYGAFRIAVRRECLVHNNIWFSLLFGGGAIYQAGEDNLFITDCIQAGICCMASKETIGVVKQEVSTWFKGYDEKYYRDRGALFAALYGRLGYFVLFLFEIRKKRLASGLGCRRRLKLGYAGIKEYLRKCKCKS